jgi:ADP-ribosyl-[dinitrogen reductase] hydrolase
MSSSPGMNAPPDRTATRIAGSLLGLAVGDCLGTAVEGRSADAIAQRYGRLDHFIYHPTAWTDDTQQALVLAEATANEVPDPVWAGNRFVEMRHRGPWHFGLHRGTGRGFRSAVDAFARSGDPRSSGNPDRAGNGAAMRIAPLAAAMQDLPDKTFRQAIVDVSLLTHREPRAVLGALAVARVARAMAADPLYPLEPARQMSLAREIQRRIEQDAAWMRQSVPEVAASPELASQFPGALAAALGGSRDGLLPLKERLKAVEATATAERGWPTDATDGFVLASVPAAIALAVSSRGFQEAVVEAVNLGGDTDTVAAMVGGMAGAAAGAGSIPSEWRQEIACWPELETWAWCLAGQCDVAEAPGLMEVEYRLCRIVRGETP